MTQLLLDAELRKKLKECKEPIQLIDEAGEVVAWVMPTLPPPASMRPSPPPIRTEEEYALMEAGPEYTTEELLDHLERL